MTQNSTPVLFITFARPEYARQTFDAIKNAKPSKLYFYSNKARHDKPDELAKNNQIRAYKDEIDWECDLLTFFRDKHVDIYTSLWSAIDWVFDNEEQAIILEEDCVPSLAFFDFCEQLLPKYKDDLRVWVISGNNFIEGFNPGGYDYVYSRYPFMYGWASWQSRWKRVNRDNVDLNKMIEYGLHKQLFSLNHRRTQFIIRRHKQLVEFLQSNNAWDYKFGFTRLVEGGFGIVPVHSLVSNIGVIGHHNKSGKEGLTHNRIKKNDSNYIIQNPPPFIIPNYHYDRRFFDKVFYKKTRFPKSAIRFLNKFSIKLKQFFTKIFTER